MRGIRSCGRRLLVYIIGKRGRKREPFSSATFTGPLENLSPEKSALFANHSLSERSEFELFANAFSRFLEA